MKTWTAICGEFVGTVTEDDADDEHTAALHAATEMFKEIDLDVANVQTSHTGNGQYTVYFTINDLESIVAPTMWVEENCDYSEDEE